MKCSRCPHQAGPVPGCWRQQGKAQRQAAVSRRRPVAARAAATENDEPGPAFTQEDLDNLVYPTKVMSVDQVAASMHEAVHTDATSFFQSFYSSVIGGITTEPALMNIPMDDHLVHRGHGVFDTAIMARGNLYQLEDHLDRFLASAESAAIGLPASREQLRRIILDTAAASQCRDGFLRYWLSAGRGGFTLSGNDTLGPEFYCLCYNGPSPDRDETVGWTAKTSPIPNKPAAFSELKSVDYLQNALCLMDAQAEGKDQGIFVHADGTVCEGPNLNVGIVTEEGIVVVPPFEGCLAGCTMARVMDLIPRYMQLGSSEDIVGVRQAPITIEDAYKAKEVFMTGGSIPVAGVVRWDDRPIGDGLVGINTLAIRSMILNDMREGSENADVLTPVPYGMLSGMLDDLC